MGKIITFIVLIVLAVVLFAGYRLGVFNSPTIEASKTGPYKIACLDHIGPYKNIPAKIENVKKLLSQQNIECREACGLYFDDPQTVASDKLRSKAGYILQDDPAVEILEKMDIPERETVTAKIKAHPAVAPLKVYSKLKDWLANNKYTVTGPCLEIYHNDGIVEVQMPIAQEKAENKL